MTRNYLLIITALALLVLAASVAGCSGLTGDVQKGDGTPSGVTNQQTPYYPAPDGSWEYRDPSIYYPTPIPTMAPDASADIYNRKVIMTAYLSLETGSFDRVFGQVRALAPGAGGYVQSSSTSIAGNNRRTGTITLKVPQSAYESTIASIRGLGTVKADSSSGSDVTGTYIDVQARLNNSRAEEARLLGIMAKANNTQDVLSVERELARVQGDIESYQARLDTLTNQVDFATITVYVAEPQPVVAFDWGLGQAFTDAIHGFVGMIGGLIVLTGYLVPLALYFVIMAAVLYFCFRVFLWWYRRSKQPKKLAEEKP